MMLLSANPLAANKLLNPSTLHPTTLPRIPNRLLFIPPPPLLLRSPSPVLAPISAAAASSTTTTTTAPDLQVQDVAPQDPLPNWEEFAHRASGEWDGFGVEFTSDGAPVELPENVVPEAFREWGVQVLDWQTQCPTLASGTADSPELTYKLIKLLPTVGCEADAATRHSVDERSAGGPSNMALAFAYDPSGSYVAAWPVEGKGKRVVEVEHCLVDPRDREARLRVVQVVGFEETGGTRLERIRVFSEQWYGPFRNGEQLGGCAIRESGFASTAALEKSEVVGEWRSVKFSTASLRSNHTGTFHELMADRPRKCIRDQMGLVMLPKQLWCSLKEGENGESMGEVGWLLDHGSAMTSRCVFYKDGRLKEIAIAQEAAGNLN